jgi:hypothetical protein
VTNATLPATRCDMATSFVFENVTVDVRGPSWVDHWLGMPFTLVSR